MSEIKHTPGPWKFETVRTSFGLCHKIGPFPWKHDKQNHACIYMDYPNHDGRGLFEDELTANARLIAAAPDLLAELQNIADAKPETWDEETRDQFQQWAQSRARQAIAKALGE